MNTYILFIYGNFEDREDIEFFCAEVFPSESIVSVKYIIENNQNEDGSINIPAVLHNYMGGIKKI